MCRRAGPGRYRVNTKIDSCSCCKTDLSHTTLVYCIVRVCLEPDCGHTSREVAATLDTTWNLLQDNIW